MAHYLKLLESHYTLLLFDNRGAGRSQGSKGWYRMEQLADDAAGLLVQAGRCRAGSGATGHDDGGQQTAGGDADGFHGDIPLQRLMAGAMDALGHEEVALRRTIVAAVVGFAGGGSPRAVMDNVRRGCGTGVRPTAKELDEMLKAVDAAK